MNMLRLLSQAGLWVGCCAIAACSAGGGGGAAGGGGADADNGDDAASGGTTFEPGEVTAEYRTEGDTLALLEEEDTGATASFDGAVDADTGEVELTSFTVTTEEGTLNVTLDDQQRPTQATIGTLVITATYNADGTVNYELRDGDELLDSGENVTLEDVDFGAKRIPAARLGPAAHARVFTGIEGWGNAVVSRWVGDAIAARGYRRPALGDLTEHPLYYRIQSHPQLMQQAYSIGTTAMFSVWVGRSAEEDCWAERPPKEWDYCNKLSEKMRQAIRDWVDFAGYVAKTYADSFWDDPEVVCGPHRPCPTGFVCDAGGCVPACRGPDDCPDGRKTCQADGFCVAEADDDEAPPDGDGDGDLPPDDGGGDGGAISPALEEMIGCWEVTGDSLAEADPDDEFEFRAFVFDIDDEAQLDTVWAKLYVPENGMTIYLEMVRFLEDNSGVIGIGPGSATQSITADGDDINISFSFEAEEDGEIQVRGLDIRDIVVHASGDSWSSLNASGTFFEGDTSGAEAIPNVEGQRITCLSASREDVISQAEIEEMAEDAECGEGILAMMPVLFLGFAGMKLRKSWR